MGVPHLYPMLLWGGGRKTCTPCLGVEGERGWVGCPHLYPMLGGGGREGLGWVSPHKPHAAWRKTWLTCPSFVWRDIMSLHSAISARVYTPLLRRHSCPGCRGCENCPSSRHSENSKQDSLDGFVPAIKGKPWVKVLEIHPCLAYHGGACNGIIQ